MSSHNDPLHPAIIKTTAYCPDSLAPRVGLPASINYVSGDLSPSSLADALTTLGKKKAEKMRGVVRGACVRLWKWANERGRQWGASWVVMRETLMDDNTEMRGGI